MSKKLIVVPTFNERENIAALIPQVLRQDPEIEVLVVDDSSPDGTGAVVSGLARDDGRVHLLERDRREGLGPAYRAGFEWALAHGADVVVQMDADF